jgi:Mannosyltransferase (PIG-V)
VKAIALSPGGLLRPSAWPGWAEALLIGIASRIFASSVLLVSWALRFPAPAGPRWDSPFLMWDAQWYLFVVHYGYHAGPVARTAFGPGYHDFAFFPLWPGIIVATTLGGLLPANLVAPIVANLIFIAAAVPIFRVLERVGGRSFARFGLLLFAFNPAGYVYSLAYSEPVFLLMAGLFFATSELVKAEGFGFLAGLSRLSSWALAVGSLPDLIDPATRRRGLAGILGVAGAFALWWTWIALLTHNPFGYMLGTPAWYDMDGPTRSITGLASLFLWRVKPAVVLTVIVLVVVAIGTIALWRRGERRLAFFSAACLASAYLATWDTMPRFAADAFPAFAAFAALLPRDRWRWLLVGASAVGEAILGALAVARIITP